jgi:hypothetical protein
VIGVAGELFAMVVELDAVTLVGVPEPDLRLFLAWGNVL